MATVCHYTFREIDEMLLTDTWMLFDYWKMEPPTHTLVAAYLGYKPESRKSLTKQEFEQAISGPIMTQTFGGARKLSQLPPEIRKQIERTSESPQVKKLMAELIEGAAKA